jgi:hypothetical protein
MMAHGGLRTRAEAEQTMGMPNTAPRYWTVDEVWALPEEPGVRYEVVDGELLVSPSPALRHQLAGSCGRMASAPGPGSCSRLRLTWC